MTTNDNRFQQAAADLFKGLWNEANTAVNRTEKQVTTFVSRLVERGNVSQEEARRIGGDIIKRLQKNREEMTRLLDARLESMAHMLPLPSQAEVQDLRVRVQRLQKRIDRLAQ